MAKKTSLSVALAEAAAQSGTAKAAAIGGEKKTMGARVGAKSYREGRVNVTGYFHPAVKQSLRLIQAKHPEKTVQDLLAEALDDLFAKYNIPQTVRVSSG
jgi:hypothetical protein